MAIINNIQRKCYKNKRKSAQNDLSFILVDFTSTLFDIVSVNCRSTYINKRRNSDEDF